MKSEARTKQESVTQKAHAQTSCAQESSASGGDIFYDDAGE